MIKIEVCERLSDYGHDYRRNLETSEIEYVVVPKYHAQLEGNGGVWACGLTPYAAIGDLILHHPEIFGVEVEILPGKLPR